MAVLQFTGKKKPKKQVTTCIACKRRLTDKNSRERGYGPVCFAKRGSLVMAELEKAGQMRLGDL